MTARVVSISGFRPAQEPSNDFDIVRDDLERAFNRAYSEWEWVRQLRERPEFKGDPVLDGIEAHLANRADNAFAEMVEAYP